MDIQKAIQLASSLMEQHGLFANHWTLQFDSSKRRFGVCKYRSKIIGLSRELVSLNDEDQVRDTILHEIAHALVGHGNGHGPVWKAKCVEIGAKPERCYSTKEVIQGEMNYEGTCGGCGTTYKRMKAPTRELACKCVKGPFKNKHKVIFKKVGSLNKAA